MNYGGYLICLYVYFLSFMCLVIQELVHTHTLIESKRASIPCWIGSLESFFMMTQPMSVCTVCACVRACLLTCLRVFDSSHCSHIWYIFEPTNTETIDNLMWDFLAPNSIEWRARMNANTAFFSLANVGVVFSEINERFLPVRPFSSFKKLPFFISRLFIAAVYSTFV